MVLSSTSINVSWTDPLPCDINGMIVNYTVRVDEDDIVVSDGERSRVLSNLTAFTNYTISVSVSTSVGRGPFSDTITRRTEEDGMKHVLIQSRRPLLIVLSHTNLCSSWSS